MDLKVEWTWMKDCSGHGAIKLKALGRGGPFNLIAMRAEGG